MGSLAGHRVETPVRQRALALLVSVGLAAAVGLAFLSHAPNRLVSGAGVSLWQALGGAPAGMLMSVCVPAAVLLAAVFVRPTPRSALLVAVAAAVLLAALLGLAGLHATALARGASPLARTSFGAGFWVLAALCALALAEALKAQRWPAWAQALAWAGACLPLVAMLVGGHLADLSLLKEYANRAEVFNAALVRHVQIVSITLAATLAIGVPLGVAAWRHARLARPLFALLNLVQTVPSIALFALLMAPLAGLGVSGIGLVPAVIALTLYSLLPIVRSIEAGLGQVPAPAIEAAMGMGFTPRQRFWRIAVPIALPALLAGLRVCTVQAIGLAVVAALIGAGGLGAIVFQGLLGSALDLVLLGVLPVVALAVLADALFTLAAGCLPGPQP